MAIATTQRFSDVVAGVLEGTAGSGELARSLQAHGLAVSSARVLALTVTDVTPQVRTLTLPHKQRCRRHTAGALAGLLQIDPPAALNCVSAMHNAARGRCTC